MEKTEPNLIDPKHKKNFDFIDSIRCLAMIGIVMEHSVYNGTYIFEGFPPKHIVYMCLIQLSKFGTIAFFVLAGFLLGDKFTTYSSWEYFKKRLSNTFMPWLVWSLIFLIAVLTQRYVAIHKSGDEYFFLNELKSTSKMIYFFTNYWFIINFLFCIAILLLFKRNLYAIWVGLIFFICTLIYSINVNYEWFTPTHTLAIFGFIFYLWLGAMCNKYWEQLSLIINKTSMSLFITGCVITFIWSVYDVTKLIEAKSTDPYNTLRLSNIFYSLAAIMLLIKIKNFPFTKYLQPRKTTYGIYLIHFIFVGNILPEIFRPFHLPTFQNMNLVAMLLFILIRFVLVYGLTLFVIWILSKTRFKWTVGLH